MNVELGNKAPDFTLPTDGNGSVTLSKLKGKKVVLYFYPKDDTSGCTAEACGFRDSFPDYGGTGAVVIGISKDSVTSHDKFKKKHELPFKIHGHRALHLSPRCRRCRAWRVAESKSTGPCRRSPQSSTRSVR